MAPRTARRFAVPFLAAALLAAAAQPAAADQVIADDLIGQSSACFGFDCVDGEAFGVDTIRMKENNTRLNFDDTSASAGFANNDWTLVANEQPSGGRNIFMLQDVTAGTLPFGVLAGAPTDSLMVKATGEVAAGGAVTQAGDGFAAPGTLDPVETLDKIDALPVGTYELPGDTTRHVGPSGADFRAAFGVGNSDATIAPADLAGISLVGVRALDDQVDTLGGRVNTLTTRVDALDNRPAVADVSGRVTTAEQQIAALAKKLEPLDMHGLRITELAAFGTAGLKRIEGLEGQNKSLRSTNRRLAKRISALDKRLKALERAAR